MRADHNHGIRAVLHDRFFTWVWELVSDGTMEVLLVRAVLKPVIVQRCHR